MAETEEASGELAPAVAPIVRVSGVPQFSTAEYAHLPETETCALCSQRLGESYYRSAEKKFCSGCAERIFEAYPRDTSVRFTRGLLFGSAAALAALAIYAGIMIMTYIYTGSFIYIGYLSLGVGWLIGKAIIKGSSAVGGRRYQIAAVALTYLSIAFARVPILIYSILHNPKIHFGPGFHITQVMHLCFGWASVPLFKICTSRRWESSGSLFFSSACALPGV